MLGHTSECVVAVRWTREIPHPVASRGKRVGEGLRGRSWQGSRGLDLTSPVAELQMEDLKRSVPGRKHGEDLGDVDLGDGSVNMTPKTAQATEAALTKGDASDATALPAKETIRRAGR